MMSIADPHAQVTCDDCCETIEIKHHIHILAYGRDWQEETRKEASELKEKGWLLVRWGLKTRHYCPECKHDLCVAYQRFNPTR